MAKFKILKTGETDIESSDIWRFCVHSDYPTQKIVSAGQTTLTIPAGENSGIKTINHSLGYPPIVMAMFETAGGRFVKVFGGTLGFINASIYLPSQVFIVAASTDKVVAYNDDGSAIVDANVAVNDVVQFTLWAGSEGALPTPLQPNTNYYVVEMTTYGSNVSFKISTTPGGGVLDLTNTESTFEDNTMQNWTPRTQEIALLYSVKTTNSQISFVADPLLDTPLVASNTDITVYYIILYDQI